MSATRTLPSFDELPQWKGFSGCAWDVWGENDQLGTVNLLTPEVVKEAAKEIKCVHASFFPGRVPQAIGSSLNPLT